MQQRCGLSRVCSVQFCNGHCKIGGCNALPTQTHRRWTPFIMKLLTTLAIRTYVCQDSSTCTIGVAGQFTIMVERRQRQRNMLYFPNNPTHTSAGKIQKKATLFRSHSSNPAREKEFQSNACYSSKPLDKQLQPLSSPVFRTATGR